MSPIDSVIIFLGLLIGVGLEIIGHGVLHTAGKYLAGISLTFALADTILLVVVRRR